MAMTSNSIKLNSKTGLLPFGYAKRHGVLLASWGQLDKEVFCRRSPSLAVLSELQRSFGLHCQYTELPDSEFTKLLNQVYQGEAVDSKTMADDIGENLDLVALAENLSGNEDLLEQEDDAPVIRLINALLSEAVKDNASDIHIETFEKRVIVRFRIDGVLKEIVQPRKQLAPLLISRIKVMAKLDIAEKRVPQDGRISLKLAGREVDVRVSTLPSYNGERIVMRLLDKTAARLDMKRLGMSISTLKGMRELLSQSHGIILVTGPTGSGKTTTLYAGLTELNGEAQNILTVEDPIEYNMEGIGQTQVNLKTDMTFARGLRAILRQDPDIIMIGEIRDRETAEIAIQASLTGHLVLSTLHTNTAVGAMTRLLDMGIESFLLSSSLIGVLAQRLVRMLCPVCKTAATPTAAESALLGIPPDSEAQIFRSQGCQKCNHLGYQGRTGIYELLLVDSAVREMIHQGASEQQIVEHCRACTQSIRQDGIDKILAGLTSIEEVLRVTRDD